MPAAAGRQSNQMGPSMRGGDPPAIKIGKRGRRPGLDTPTQMLGNAACWSLGVVRARNAVEKTWQELIRL